MVFHWCLYNKQNITCPRVDMNFIFEWSTRYLTRSLRSLVRYRVDHSKIKIHIHARACNILYESKTLLKHNLRCFFYADKVICNTNNATRSITKKLTFSLAAMKLCNSMLRATSAVPTQTFFRLRINAFLVGKILLLFH